MGTAARSRVKLAGVGLLAIAPMALVHYALADPRLRPWFPLLALPAGLAHAVIYSALLWFFARSLRQGAEPVVTRIARRIRGELPPELERYTRRVTLAWCLFFAAQLAFSAILLLFQPLSVWIAFLNFWNLPLLLAMGAGEYGYRLVRYRHHRHESVWEMVRAFRAVRSS